MSRTHTRADHSFAHYFPLDGATVAAADAILHVHAGEPADVDIERKWRR